MNLGSLATIGLQRPANLAVVVMDNGEYATTGGQPTPTAHGADLAAAARAMGIAEAAIARTEDELTARMNVSGLSFVVAKVTESRPSVKPPLDCVRIKQRVMATLGIEAEC
jgi:thiamine pyrophosphate-dependent acetolactate synthase large subunit-like protein